MRLLPQNKDVGWTPYAWLIYLTSVPFYGYATQHTSLRFWTLTVLGMAVFLVLYFRGYWVEGKKLLWIIAAILLLGVVYAPSNPGASVYFIYAAAFVAFTGEAGFALRILPLIVVLIALETLAFHLTPYFWVSASVFSMLVGAINIHYRQRGRETKKLLMAQEEVEQMAKIAERERIGRDLHDVLGHTLSVIVLKSELAAKLAEKDPIRAVQEIHDVERISRDALGQVRSTVRGYQSRGLLAEVEQARAALRTAGVQAECDFDAPKLPAAQEGVLALALREAVTNVIRHARATSCSLILRQENGFCRLEIKDDGCGRASAEGVGLSGMRQRVESLGGKLERVINSGTRLIVTLPVKQGGL
ncbi:MAG TPA: sensor histidine kinase [Candidatus Angelobacter sp.]|jgi:two-component system sensor histidine kinase DesK